MAVNVETTKVSSDLSAIVSSAVSAVKKVRSTEQARKEAEFQRAIANGMSYEEQVKFREKQLADEEGSSFSDDTYIATLTKSVSETKKLARFNTYRTKYAQTLGDLSSGKINATEYLGTLQKTLIGIDDPDLRLEVQNDIVEATKAVKTYQDTILSNQVKKAKYDGTSAALTDAVSKVQSARMNALINNNEDEVTAYDETLSALGTQLSTTKIQDSLTDFQVTSATRGVNPVEKLNFVNAQLANADPSAPIKIGDRTYASAQQYWTLERDNFLAGTSQVFGNFFKELGDTAKDVVDANTAKFGYPTQSVLDDTLATFNELRSKPEVAPFVAKLDITQASIMSSAVDTIAKVVNAVGTNNLTFKEADTTLQNIGAKYGIDVNQYRLQLDENLRTLARGGVLSNEEASAMAPDVNVELPNVSAPTALPGATPAAGATNTGVHVVQSGENLGLIAKKAGTTVDKLLELNPELKANPNMIKPEQQIKLPGTQPTPVVAPTLKPTTPAPTATSTPAAPAQAPTMAPAPAPAPAPAAQPAAAPKSNYVGSSLVDYLKTSGQDSSVNTRAKLALEKGVVKSEDEYITSANAGTNADMNTKLLKALRGS